VGSRSERAQRVMLPVRFMGPPPVVALGNPSRSAGQGGSRRQQWSGQCWTGVRVGRAGDKGLAARTASERHRSIGFAGCQPHSIKRTQRRLLRTWVKHSGADLPHQRSIHVQLEAVAALWPRGDPQQVPGAVIQRQLQGGRAGRKAGEAKEM
jgi:hypothetical protein